MLVPFISVSFLLDWLLKTRTTHPRLQPASALREVACLSPLALHEQPSSSPPQSACTFSPAATTCPKPLDVPNAFLQEAHCISEWVSDVCLAVSAPAIVMFKICSLHPLHSNRAQGLLAHLLAVPWHSFIVQHGCCCVVWEACHMYSTYTLLHGSIFNPTNAHCCIGAHDLTLCLGTRFQVREAPAAT